MVVLICIALIISDVEHLFMCLMHLISCITKFERKSASKLLFFGGKLLQADPQSCHKGDMPRCFLTDSRVWGRIRTALKRILFTK